MARERIIIALACIFALAGCSRPDQRDLVGTETPPMPVVVDYYPHLTKNPVPRYATGRVDPVEQGVGRSRDFGPEPSADVGPGVDIAPPPAVKPAPRIEADRAPKPPAKPKPKPTDKLSSLDGEATSPQALKDVVAAFRARFAAVAADPGYLALAESRKTRKAKAAKLARADSDDDQIGQDGATEAVSTKGVEDRGNGYRLNFEDAEIKDVLQAVLGNVLGLNYTIAPNVTGRITISSSAGQTKEDLLSTLETVLSMQGLSLTRSNSMYRVAPSSIGGGPTDVLATESGFGISVVPLRFTSVASMNKLLSGFVTDADGIRIDAAHNTVIIRGPRPRREEIIRAVKAFDGDWMHTQAVSMFELKRSHPDEVVGELTRIFNSEANTDNAGVIEFKAMKRLRSVMVISKNETLIHRAGVWIRRLDHQDTSETSSIFVYRPLYRDARELTHLVNGLFGQSDSGGSNSGVGGVFYQSKDGQNGQSGSSGSSSGFGGSGSSGGSQGSGGLFSASTSGSSAGGLGSSSGGSGGGNSGGSGFGSGSGSSGSSGSSFGSLGGSGGNGLKGNLADPVEAGEERGGGNEKLKLTADTSNNTVVAYTDGETYAKVKAVLKQLDIPPLQVAVNVIIAEVQLNDELKYGVQTYLNQSQKSVGSIGFTTSPTSVVSSAASGLTSGVTAPIANAISPGSGFNFISGGQSSPNIILSALDSISRVHILSTPSIVVMENKPATLEVGNQVPVTTQSAQSNLTADAPTVNSVTYLDTGIILKIIPRVGQNGVVDMQIDQEISSVVPDATGSTTGSLTPTISKRRIASDISVRSGQNVLLAGLITDTKSRSNGQVPFIGPQLGNLFGNTDNSNSRTELVMFIRPVIVRNGGDATEVTREFKRDLTGMNLSAPPVYKP